MTELDADHHSALASITRALAAVRWSWAKEDQEELGAQLGWSTGQPVGDLGLQMETNVPLGNGHAFVMRRGDEIDRVVLPIMGGLPAFPDRVDAFATVAATLTDVLGEPIDRRPGPSPTIWWPATSGFLGVIDDGNGIDLELRPTPLPQSASPPTRGPTAHASQPDEADDDWDDDENVLIERRS